jgi:hypothetical protein
MITGRGWLSVGVAVVVAGAAAGGAAAAGVFRSAPHATRVAAAGPAPDPRSSTARPLPAASSASPHPRRHAHSARRSRSAPAASTADAGPLVPATGALLGAYVKPAQTTSAGQITAVRSFEQQVGHNLPLVHVYHPWAAKFPSPADTYFADSGQVLLLTWGGEPNTLDIINGRYDAMIRARAIALKALGRPVLLEWRHEMDRPDLRAAMHSPADYVAAWKHMRAIFTSVGATNVSWVWCPTAYGFKTGRAAAYYPGNNEVNWICADAYSATPAVPLSDVLGPFLSWAAHHSKPIIIGEFGVSGDRARWAAWFTQVGEMIRQHPQIKALAYFDSDGADGPGQTLTGNQPAVAAFGQLLDQSYFTPATPAYPRS